jgi:hypothetical protein
MLAASLALRHRDGRIPQLGDGDSGRVLPTSSHRPPTHDHLLWLGTAILGTPVPGDSAPHGEIALILGGGACRDAAAKAPRRARADLPRAKSFRDAGVHVLRGRRSHLVVRCGGVGQNGNGGHAHNDLLSFELSYANRLVVADPGTYAYTADAAARNRFRGTRVHSTLIVDAEEINPIDNEQLFSLRQVAAPLPPELHAQAEPLELTCGHDGYRRLRPPAIVRRTFRLAFEADELWVIDRVENGSSHSVWSHVQLAPGWSVRPISASAFSLVAEGLRLTLDVVGHRSVQIRKGWVSSRFGVRDAAPLIAIEASPQEPTHVGYRIGESLELPTSAAAGVVAEMPDPKPPSLSFGR